MAQISFTADITAAAFPLLSDWANRTIVQQSPIDGGKPPMPTPQILYCQDVLPTNQGYKSVSYKDLVPPPATANLTFSNIYTVSDTSSNKALIGITTDSTIYMLTNASPLWVNVTPAGWGNSDLVTMAQASGNYYLYLANKGCYLVNITGVALTLTALSGLTAANIVGIVGATNYLIAYDTKTIYWSSTTNPLDFVPSLITGAGSAVPYNERGKIVAVVPLGSGFCIYTDANAILASFSNNTQFPWIFRPATKVSGIAGYKQVSQSISLDFHIALTTVGVVQITAQGGEPLVPEVTDFLASRTIEAYDYPTDTIISTNLGGITPVVSSVAVIGARYIVISYGATTYTDALVYDLTLKRYGKLHIPHVACFEITAFMEGVPAPYVIAGETGQTYAAASPQTYGSTSSSMNAPPKAGRAMGFLQADGTIKLAYLNYESNSDAGVLVLGKYEAKRGTMSELIELIVESVPIANTSLILKVTSSIDGRTSKTPIVPIRSNTLDDIRTYNCRTAGASHNVIFLGSFNLTAVQLKATVGGSR